MATARFLFCIFCFALSGSIGMSDGHLLIRKARKHRYYHVISAAESAVRTQLTGLAEKEIGVREKTNHNDGRKVETYLKVVKLKRGAPWCAAFISYVFMEAGFNRPRSGWSPDMFPDSRLARSALPANLLGIYFPEYGRIAHVGMVIREEGHWVISCEGNTDVAGSREGGGVYLKRRHIRTISRFSDWVSEQKVSR